MTATSQLAGAGDGSDDARGVEHDDQALPQWERELRELAVAPRTVVETNDVPLALEFTLRAASRYDERAMPTLSIRMMRPDARGGGRADEALAWGSLDPRAAAPRGIRTDHLMVARELYALAKPGSPTGSVPFQAEQYLALNASPSGRLWSVLGEARRIGMRLVGPGRGAADIGRLIAGEVVFDATRTSSGGRVTAQLYVRPGAGPEPGPGTSPESTHLASELGLEPIAFIGAPAHGVVCLQGDPAVRPVDRAIRLVQLTAPVPDAVGELLLKGRAVAIPETDLDRFAEELWPQLRTVAPVLSSDDSLAPPVITGPALTLVVRYHPEQHATLSWAWSYQVGRSARRVPLGVSQAGLAYRDLEAERASLAQADLRRTRLQPLGMADAAGRPIAAATHQLEATAAMQFTTDLLPALRARRDLDVVVEGVEPEYRDITDSLVIGVSTADRGDADWFDLGITITIDGMELPFERVFAALAAGQTRMFFDDGAYLSLDSDRLLALRDLIEEARALTDTPPGELRINRYQSDLWSELVALGVVGEQAAAWKAQVDALAQLSELPDHPLPAGLQAELRPYQHDGFRWLSTLRALGLGGILADDMGLGKTLQALAMIVEAREQDPGGPPFLVVAPTSVVGNWVTEAARFAPGLAVVPMVDTLAKAGTTLEAVVGASGAPAIIVTTYTLLRLDADAYGARAWSGLILDEAQAVKNPRSLTYRCVRELRAPFTLALTGTPMENNVMELWALLSVVAPGLFPDPRRFGEHFAKPIERGDAERRAVLRRRIRPLMLRRTKELVAPDLPAKQEQRLEVMLDPEHRKLYDTYLQRERQKILGLLDDFGRNRVTILQSITLLRQLSLDPGLVDAEHAHIPGAKLDALMEQLEEVVDGGHRALVFSQFTRFLGKVRDRLDAHGMSYSYLDGSTRQRQRVIDGFKTGDAPVFLISLKAGGFGLNLTEADYCFLLDPWWNPAAEAQAVDRTHRIGQTRPVMVYRLISEGTIEQKVAALAARKAELFRGVVDDGDLFASSITADDIRGLLG